MAYTEVTQPIKRGPGRPRKIVAPTPPAGVDEWKSPEPAPDDEHIGESVDDDRVTAISFPDGREYRVENGVIVERVR